MSVVEQLIDHEAATVGAAQGEYRDMVRQLAEGNDPPLTDVQRVLRVLGKTPRDMASAVSTYNRRRDLQQQLQDVEAAALKRDELQKQKAAIDAELLAAEAKHREQLYPILFELQRNQDLLQTKMDIERGLRESCKDQDILSQLFWNSAQFARVEGTIAETGERYRLVRSGLEIANKNRDQEQIETRAARVDSVAEELADLESERARLIEQAKQLHHDMIAAEE